MDDDGGHTTQFIVNNIECNTQYGTIMYGITRIRAFGLGALWHLAVDYGDCLMQGW